MKRIITVTLIFIATIQFAKAQQTDSLLNAISTDNKHQDVLGAFKATRLILSPTTATIQKNNLNVLIVHRFGDIASPNTGAQTLYGLDRVQDVYIGLEYGLSNNLNVNFGRSTIGELLEVGLKYAVVHQSTDNTSPVAITLLGDYGVNVFNYYGNPVKNRSSYLGQAIISRKFSSNFSLQVSPIFLSTNTALPNYLSQDHQIFALSGAARLKITKRMSIVVDYEHPLSAYNTNKANGFVNPLGFGIEVETGGHVFTLNITNAKSISEINSLNLSNSSYGRGEYRIGFTISRIFDFNKHQNNYK